MTEQEQRLISMVRPRWESQNYFSQIHLAKKLGVLRVPLEQMPAPKLRELARALKVTAS